MAPWGLDEHHVTYARALAERFGMLLRVESQKDGWVVPLVDPRARGAGLGVWAEGAGSLARLAAVDGRLAHLCSCDGDDGKWLDVDMYGDRKR